MGLPPCLRFADQWLKWLGSKVMSLATFLHRVKRTSWSDRLILAEAVGALIASSLAIRLLPFKWLARKASSVGRGKPGTTRDRTTQKARWAIGAAGPYLPWRIVCFQEGLALHSMLRRRGIASLLHYGVGQSAERGVSGHVWVSVDGRIIVGEEEAGNHACLATFPAPAEQP